MRLKIPSIVALIGLFLVLGQTSGATIGIDLGTLYYKAILVMPIS